MFLIKYICNLSKNEGWDSFTALLYFSDAVKSGRGKPWHSDDGIKNKERNLPLISKQRNAFIFVLKSKLNFALLKYIFHLKRFKSFKTVCRQSYF